MKKIMMLTACVAIQSCSTSSYFYNDQVPSGKSQLFFDQDSAYCHAYVDGIQPYPYAIVEPRKSYRTYGVTSIRPTSNAIYITDRQTTREYIATNDAMVAGLTNISLALVAAEERKKPYNNCMTTLGWYSAPTPTRNEETEKPLSTIDSLKQKYKKQSYEKAYVVDDRGNASASWGAPTVKVAKEYALKMCTDKGWTNCKVVDVNGYTVTPDNYTKKP